jgi:MEDS: MEthanogen/methylotroph, DcmR Sensory domain
MTAISAEIRKTGIEVVGDMPWGTHFCLFYETKADLLDILTSYCSSGLESGEFCLWIVAEPLTVEEATVALKDTIPDFGRYLADSSIEIVSARDWYLSGGAFDLKRVTAGWAGETRPCVGQGLRRGESDRGYGLAAKEGLETLL